MSDIDYTLVADLLLRRLDREGYVLRRDREAAVADALADALLARLGDVRAASVTPDVRAASLQAQSVRAASDIQPYAALSASAGVDALVTAFAAALRAQLGEGSAASALPIQAASATPFQAASATPFQAASATPFQAASATPFQAASATPFQAASATPFQAASPLPAEPVASPTAGAIDAKSAT